ncbi:hypothetical protein AB5I39_08660 [Sphingomonas sp. MMS24-J45]|uniref:hypothetical protein n=1 Tax=Sphingomonas sp. MMS24-J45 TaxID=3238806 RepID=UPI00384BA609
MTNDDLPEHAPRAGWEDKRDLSLDQALALDLALGILVEPEHGHAVERCGGDDAFAALVTGYRAMLDHADEAVSFDADDAPGITPSDATWAAIQARIAPGKGA